MTVHNHRKTDAQVQQDVLNELKWDTRVEPTEVGVEVRGGVVTAEEAPLTRRAAAWRRRRHRSHADRLTAAGGAAVPLALAIRPSARGAVLA